MPSPYDIGALRFDLAVNLLRTSLPSNLYSGDRNSMAHGIECRYPFLDYELVDFTTRLPDSAYLEDAWGKALLRQSMTGVLPSDIAWRADKVGFAAPQDRWLASPDAKNWLAERIFDPALGDVPGYSPGDIRKAWLLHQSGAADFSSTLWQWASASELLDMQRSQVWREGRVTEVVSARLPKTSDADNCTLFHEEGYYVQGSSGGQKTAWIISYTPAAKEPRLIRQAKALEEAGWKVVVLGLPAADPSPPSWLSLIHI